MNYTTIIFCPVCGTPIEKGSKKCLKCGKVIEEQKNYQYDEETESPTRALYDQPVNYVYPDEESYPEEEKDKNKTAIVITVIATIVAVILIVVIGSILIFGNGFKQESGLNKKTSKKDNTATASPLPEEEKQSILLNPFEKITVEFLGENGKGYAKITVNDEANVLDTSYFTIQNNGTLKNGDTVTITFNKENFLTYHSEYDVRTDSSQYVVSSLAEPEASKVANPFEYIDVYFSGSNGRGYVNISSMSEEFSAIYYYLEGANGTLKNGDVITIKFDKDQFSMYHPGYTFINVSRAYVVSGLDGGAVETPEPAGSGVPEDLEVEGSANGYILPYSNIRYYDEEFLSTMTDKQLKFARNEITARHGRKFVTAELQQYFETTPWYSALYEPTYFDNNIFGTMNEYEKGNMERIKKIEQSRKAN